MQKHLTQLVLAGLIAGLSLPCAAQTPLVLKDSGLKKLGVFIGSWYAESTDPNQPVSASYTCQWAPNGNFLIADQAVNNAGTKSNNLSIYNYNPAKDDYTLTLVGIAGMEPFTIPITYHGDTLFYHSEYSNNGKKMYNRTLNIFLSPSSYTYLIQSSEDGEHWTTQGMGKAKKQPS